MQRVNMKRNSKHVISLSLPSARKLSTSSISSMHALAQRPRTNSARSRSSSLMVYKRLRPIARDLLNRIKWEVDLCPKRKTPLIKTTSPILMAAALITLPRMRKIARCLRARETRPSTYLCQSTTRIVWPLGSKTIRRRFQSS